MPSGMVMVDVLRGPLAIASCSYGYDHSYKLYTSPIHRATTKCHCGFYHDSYVLEVKFKTKLSRIKESLSVSKGWGKWSGGVARGGDRSSQVLYKISSESAEEESDEAIEEQEICEDYLGQKLSPSQSLPDEQNSDVASNAGQFLKVSEGPLSVAEIGLVYFEERDEEILSKRLLKLSRMNKIRSALELHRSMEYSGLQPNLHAYNSLVLCLIRNGLLDDALRIFESMKVNETVSGHTCSMILKAVADAWGSDAALSLFEELEKNSNLNKHFDAIVYNTMISVFGKVNNWVQTERIWKSMRARGHTGTTITYRLLVCIFVRCNQNELALDAYHEMLQNGVQPGEDAMQAIIGACTKEGKWDLALGVFRNMLNSGLNPNIIACNALINSLAKSSKIELAFEVYGLMKSLGHSPDTYTWNALLVSLNRANQHADALRLFESIGREENFVSNLHIYNTVLMSCRKLGLWDRALQLLWEMETTGLSVSTESYNLVIGACEVARRPKVALEVYAHMVHQNKSPDTFTFLSLIRGCIWGSLWKEVQEILSGTVPNCSLYNAAIQGMCLRDKIDEARKLYIKMRELGLKPDGKTRALMLQNLPKN